MTYINIMHIEFANSRLDNAFGFIDDFSCRKNQIILGTRRLWVIYKISLKNENRLPRSVPDDKIEKEREKLGIKYEIYELSDGERTYTLKSEKENHHLHAQHSRHTNGFQVPQDIEKRQTVALIKVISPKKKDVQVAANKHLDGLLAFFDRRLTGFGLKDKDSSVDLKGENSTDYDVAHCTERSDIVHIEIVVDPKY
ncbi:MAG: hypothetical protein AAGD38_21530 [Acidobacteriota bacterium]